MIDNQLWITINCYVAQNWCCLFLLISLEHVIERRGFDNLIKVIVDALKKHVGVFDANVVARLLSFGVDCVNVFQGVRNGVTHQLQNKFAPHFNGIHCMAQHTNLAMQMLSHILVVKCIEDLLQSFFYFFHSPKKHLEFLKLVGLMKVKGNKILQYVRTCCINLLSPTKWFLSMYIPLVCKDG
jgi:hypothetical protein